MKRLLFLSVVALVAISVVGCGRTRRMWCQSGTPCETCDPCADGTTTYDDGSYIVPGDSSAVPQLLPGPVNGG